MEVEAGRLIAPQVMQCCGGVRTSQEILSLADSDNGHVLMVEQHALWCCKAQRALR